ncbi:MAG: ATP-binding protein, partial [Pirellulales bacterium]
MQNAHWIWSTNQRIPSERGAGQSIAEEILGELRKAEWDEKDIFGVRLALEEALVNAIIHGNRLDKQKSVTVECKMSA